MQKIRGLEIENKKFKQDYNEIPKAELERIIEITATNKELYIITKRNSQSKVRFSQIPQGNYEYLIKLEYFTILKKHCKLILFLQLLLIQTVLLKM